MMSDWNVNEHTPALADIYDEEEQQYSESEAEKLDDEIRVDEDDYDRSHVRPPYCQLSSRSPRDRSRSPIRRDDRSEPIPCSSSGGVEWPMDQSESGDDVMGFYDEGSMPVEVLMEDEFPTPDAHDLYAGPEHGVSVFHESVRLTGDRRPSGRGVRGRGRGMRRGGVVRVRGRPARGRSGERWASGDPLYHIYVTDNDVPAEVYMASDVLRRREEMMTMNHREAHIARGTNGQIGEGDRVNHKDEGLQGAANGMGSALLDGDHHLHFDWFPMESFQGEEELFVPERTGSIRSFSSAYEAFRSYWDDVILQHIVDETNSYATTIPSAGFQAEWYPTNLHEILCLFAFWVMLGVIRMPTMKSCFSVSPILKTEVFRRIFTMRRYDNLTRALRLSDTDPADDTVPSSSGSAENFDRLHCLRPVLDYINIKFQENYVLSKDICIDECLSLWKGKLNFRQYIQSKLGIKTFELCECSTGYLWSFVVYRDKQSSLDVLNPLALNTTSAIQQLIGPLLNKGYRLFMDNWYNSPLFARYLKLNRTDFVGTLWPTQQDVPVLLSRAPLKQGQFVARHSGDVCVLAWQDKKRITMLSTCHGIETGLPHVLSKFPLRPQQFKPQMVLDYEKSMGGIDLKDQMLEPYLLERTRGIKWHIKLLKCLLNSSIVNARILLQSSEDTHLDHLHFRLNLVDAILTNHLSNCPVSRRLVVSTSRGSHSLPGHIAQHAHWPIHMPQTPNDIRTNRQHREKCHVCLREGRKTQKTPYMCESCKVPLCAVNCFKTFHSS